MNPELQFRADRLRDLMKVNAYTQRRLAHETGVTLRAAQKWCAGGTPSSERLRLIAGIFDKSPAWFYEPIDEPTEQVA